MKIKMVTGLVVVFIISFLFYWYEYRPTQIRSKCENDMEATIKGTGKTIEQADFSYKMCLRAGGLEK